MLKTLPVVVMSGDICKVNRYWEKPYNVVAYKAVYWIKGVFMPANYRKPKVTLEVRPFLAARFLAMPEPGGFLLFPLSTPLPLV